MSHLDRQVTIACPLGQAENRIDNFLRVHGNRVHEAVSFTLRSRPSVAEALPPRPRAAATVSIAPFDRHFGLEPRYRVHWYPDIPGQIPIFSGEMFVKGDEDYTSFSLIVRGGYTLPLSAMGLGIDLATGADVARATASDLLARIRDFVEDDCRSGERLGIARAYLS